MSEKLPNLLVESLISTETAIFNMIRTVLILSVAIKKMEKSSDRSLRESKMDLIEWLKTMVEIQKVLLKKIRTFIHLLDRDGLEEMKQKIDLKEDQECVKKIKSYTLSIMKSLYGPSHSTQIDPNLSEDLQHLTKYYVRKNLLLRKT